MKKNNKPLVSHRPHETSEWWANCPNCGALVYSTCSPFVIKEVLTIERPYRFHCGLKLDASKVNTNEKDYNNCG